MRAFLDEFLSDPMVVDFPRLLWQPILRGIILRSRPRRVAHAYASIWTEDGAPLVAGTLRMVEALQQALRAGGTSGAGRARGDEAAATTVHAAYRYGPRNLEALIQKLQASEDRPELTVVPLFPQRTGSSSGSIVEQARTLAAKKGWASRLDIVEIPPDDPDYIGAVADRVTRSEAEAAREHGPFERLLVSFHGVPVRYDRNEGHQYTTDCRATVNALRAHLGWPSERLEMTFQSRFGPEKWLQPATADRIAALGRTGMKHLGVVTPGFLTDGLETLEEIAVLGARTFRESGGGVLTAVAAVDAHPAMTRALARLVARDPVSP